MQPSDIPSSGGAAPAAASPAPRRADDPGAPFPTEVRLSPRGSRVVIAFFLVLITLPGLLREISSDRVGPTLAGVFRSGATPVAERLRGVEQRIDDGAWIAPIRGRMQTVLYRVFREGNRKVLIGRDDWLFHRPGVQALTGRGPVLGPTHSVAKDPALKEWTGPIPVILDFAEHLKERGIRLVMVPVPDKAAMQSVHLLSASAGRGAARLHHPDWPRFVEALQGRVELVHLDQSLPYLRDDTHWEAAGARAAAIRVAALLRTEPIAAPEPDGETDLSGRGDLVGSLGLVDSAAAGLRSTVRVPRVAPVESDPAAPVVLLGDSNVNMYDDPGLPFHQAGAGFASWLRACLQEPLHIIAINGGGATQVRQRFAALPADVVRTKMTVVWVLAERDLFVDPTVARANGVEWKRVAFNPMVSSPAAPSTPGDALVVVATLRAKSELLDMDSVVYRDSLFTAEFTVDRVVAGTYGPKELTVVLWNFRNRVVQPPARFTPGQSVRLTLVPFPEEGDLAKMPRTDDFLRFDLPLLYAEKPEIIGE